MSIDYGFYQRDCENPYHPLNNLRNKNINYYQTPEKQERVTLYLKFESTQINHIEIQNHYTPNFSATLFNERGDYTQIKDEYCFTGFKSLIGKQQLKDEIWCNKVWKFNVPSHRKSKYFDSMIIDLINPFHEEIQNHLGLKYIQIFKYDGESSQIYSNKKLNPSQRDQKIQDLQDEFDILSKPQIEFNAKGEYEFLNVKSQNRNQNYDDMIDLEIVDSQNQNIDLIDQDAYFQIRQKKSQPLVIASQLSEKQNLKKLKRNKNNLIEFDKPQKIHMSQDESNDEELQKALQASRLSYQKEQTKGQSQYKESIASYKQRYLLYINQIE